MAHSPLKMFKQFHNKRVLVSGQGPIHEISKNLGFTNVCTVEDIRNAFPVLDVVDQKRRDKMVSIQKLFYKLQTGRRYLTLLFSYHRQGKSIRIFRTSKL